MERPNNQFCADAGGKYCPCHLAYSGDCIKCSLIRGEKTCECKWQGVCIYNELQHNKIVPVEEREELLCKVVESKEIEYKEDLAGRYKSHCFYKPDPGICKELH